MTRQEMEQRRLRGGQMLLDGVQQARVARECQVTRTTTHRWSKEVAAKGISGLQLRHATGRPCYCKMEDLVQIASTRLHWCGWEFAVAIYQQLGISYHPEAAYKIGRKIAPDRFGNGKVPYGDKTIETCRQRFGNNPVFPPEPFIPETE